MAAPTAVSTSEVRTSQTQVNALSDGTTNCDAPPQSSVVFSPTQLGTATITNTSRCINDFTFVVWNASDINNQVNAGQSTVRLAPGQTSVINVAPRGGVWGDCTVYQRDVYFGVVTSPGADRLLWEAPNTQNAIFYATGVLWTTSCVPGGTPNEPTPNPFPPTPTPPPPSDPPVDPPTDPPSEPPCPPDEGPNPPPSPLTVFCHVPPGNPGNAQTLTIPLTAILNGHIPQHSLDHFGACTGNEGEGHGHGQ